jgi:DNA-binding CsgD family transcriptional regulator
VELVGREHECARLEAFVADVPHGVRAMLIRGEPGIGKTALWRLAVDECERAGFSVLVTRAGAEEMQLELTGLVDLFGGDGGPAVTVEDPFARGHAVLAALRALARDRPAALAVDDLQWLDGGSARALRFALRRLDREPVGVLATARDGADPLAVAATLPPGRAEELALGPLGLPDLRRLVSRAVDAIPAPMLQRISEVSGGNPLYALELARAFADDRRRGGRPTAVALPDSLQAAIAGRLEHAAELTELLRTVSALGATTVGALREALPGTPLEAQLDAAQERGLLVVDDDLHVRFANPLIGSVVYGRMPAFARRSLHARLASAAADPHVRARHLALSTDEPDAAVADLLEQAAAGARDREAFDRAAEFAGHSLQLTPPADRAGRLRRALAEIDDLAIAGDLSRALELAERLVEAFPDGPEHCEALLERSYIDDDDAAADVARLRAALPQAGDDRQRGQLLCAIAWSLALFVGDLRGGLEAARAWEALAGPDDDPAESMSSAAQLAYLEALGGHPRDDVMARAIAIEAEHGKPILWTSPRTLQAETWFWAGHLERARAQFETVREEAARTGTRNHHPYSMFDLALVDIAAGRLASAEARVEEGIEAAHDAEDTWAERLLLYPRSLVDAWRGRGERARAGARQRLEEASARSERPGVVRGLTVLGFLALSEGDHDAAAREPGEAARLLELMGYRNPGAYPVLPDAVDAHACAGLFSAAVALLERLEREAEALASPWALAAAERGRGTLALARGRADEAVAPLRASAEAFERLGHRPDAARALLLHGRALLRGGQRAQAADALAGARRRFAAIGAPLWEARAAEELERAAPGRAAGVLTPAERRIAALVADGRRNREIGQALFMSVATVEAHLTRTYRKLGIRSRSELARRVADGSIREI